MHFKHQNHPHLNASTRNDIRTWLYFITRNWKILLVLAALVYILPLYLISKHTQKRKEYPSFEELVKAQQNEIKGVLDNISFNRGRQKQYVKNIAVQPSDLDLNNNKIIDKAYDSNVQERFLEDVVADYKKDPGVNTFIDLGIDIKRFPYIRIAPAETYLPGETTEQRLSYRKKRIEAVCKTLSSETVFSGLEAQRKISSKMSVNFVVDERRKILYCQTYRTGANLWKSLLLQGANFKYENEDMRIDSKLIKNGFSLINGPFNPELLKEDLSKYKKVITVRNPLIHFLAVFRAVFETVNEENSVYRKGRGGEIIRKYRPDASYEMLRMVDDLQFEEVVQWFIDLNMNNQSIDNIWASFSSMCYPCAINYDYVAQLETLDEDMRYIVKKIAPDMSEYLINSQATSQVNKTTEEMFQKYWDIIPDLLRKRLMAMKDLDMKMFSYL